MTGCHTRVRWSFFRQPSATGFVSPAICHPEARNETPDSDLSVYVTMRRPPIARHARQQAP
jgi:hypothetical protein